MSQGGGGFNSVLGMQSESNMDSVSLPLRPFSAQLKSVVDREDLPRLSTGRPWRVLVNQKRLKTYRYAIRRVGSYRTQTMHRLVMNAPRGMEVDHINGDTLDNRKCNLRICSRSENLRNASLSGDSTSGFKGVWKKQTGRRQWVAAIYKEGKNRFLGSFASKEEAASRYDKEATRLYGNFARLNFPFSLAVILIFSFLPGCATRSPGSLVVNPAATAQLPDGTLIHPVVVVPEEHVLHKNAVAQAWEQAWPKRYRLRTR